MAENITFEESYRKLTEIVSALESGDKSLDDSIMLYKDGIEYATICRKKLDEAKLSVTVSEQGTEKDE